MNNQIREEFTSVLLELRSLVGYLGERAQFDWWPTAFFETPSKAFLEPVFSKSYQLARYHGVLEAARRLHDEQLNVGCYHLFRLPEEIEQDLHSSVLNSIKQSLNFYEITTKDAALHRLMELAAPTIISVGPKAFGPIGDLKTQKALSGIAGAYGGAFSQKLKMFPYFTEPS